MAEPPFVHEHALVETDDIGRGTRVWAFAHVLPGAAIGEDCNICDGVFVEGGATIGDRVTVKPGVQIWTGVTLEDDVFIGPNATFTNDRFPRSRQWLDDHPQTVVRRGASIGANATILPGVEIGMRGMVGAGAVVTRSVPPHAIVVGNPARIVGYDGGAPMPDRPSPEPVPTGPPTGLTPLHVGGTTLHRLPRHEDLRGSLSAGDIGVPGGVPFEVRRWFVVYDVPTREVRGEHAHRVCHQFLLCLAGSVAVVVDDGEARTEVRLDEPTVGVHIPPMVWGTQYRYTPDARLLVLASHAYDADDYIRDYGEFLAARRRAA